MDFAELLLQAVPGVSFLLRRVAAYFQRDALQKQTNTIRTDYNNCLGDLKTLSRKPGTQANTSKLIADCKKLQCDIDSLLQHYRYLVSPKNLFLYDKMHEFLNDIQDLLETQVSDVLEPNSVMKTYMCGKYLGEQYYIVNKLPVHRKAGEKIGRNVLSLNNIPPLFYLFFFVSASLLPIIAFGAIHQRIGTTQKNIPNKNKSIGSLPDKKICMKGAETDTEIIDKLLIPSTYEKYLNPLYDLAESLQTEDPRPIPLDFQSMSPARKVLYLQDYLHSLNNDLDHLRNKFDIESSSKKKILQKRLNLVQRYMPFLHVLANNERIDAMSRNNSLSYVFSVGIVIPLSNKSGIDENGPHPWGLGIIRGVDLAQRLIWNDNNNKNEPKVFLKALIYDDMNYEDAYRLSPGLINSSLPTYLSDPDGHTADLVGVIGHNRSSSINLLADCYNKVMLPVFTTSIFSSQPASGNYVHTLLPSTKQLALATRHFISQRRQLLRERVPSNQYRIIIIFDSRDSGGLTMVDSICNILRCIKLDIATSYIYLNQLEEILSQNTLPDYEIFLALNPNIHRDDVVQASRDILNKYVDKVGVNQDARIYIGPDFIDQSLENELHNWILKSGRSDHLLDIVRIGPLDWRANVELFPTDSLGSLDDVYGPGLNWSVYNALASMLVYKSLLSNFEVRPYLFNPSNPMTPVILRKNLRELRRKLNELINGSGIDVVYPATGVMRDVNPGLPLELAGPGFQVCASSIIPIQNREAYLRRRNECYIPVDEFVDRSPVK